MSTVVIGMDPHKRSATIEVMAGDEAVVGGGRYATDAAGYRSMLAEAKRWPERVWAIEGCQGIGRHIASRLLADGERVVDVPPKLSARVRVFATGQGRKTDATDAHSIALAATRMAGLRPVVADQQLMVLRILADRRRSLGEDHIRMICQLHQLLLELIPGGAKKSLSAAQAKALLAKVRPRDAAGRARRQVAAELIGDLERIYQRTKAADKELTALLAATGTTLTSLHGIGPSGAARLLTGTSDITRFRPGRTSPPGTAPRRSMLPPVTRSATGYPGAATGRSTGRCTSWPWPSSATRPKAAPTTPQSRRRETPMEAMRALKRRLSGIVYRQMIADARAAATGPGGHLGAATDSSAAGSHPSAGTSEKSLPGPAANDPTPPHPARPPARSGASHQRRPATAVKRHLLDSGEARRTLASPDRPSS